MKPTKLVNVNPKTFKFSFKSMFGFVNSIIDKINAIIDDYGNADSVDQLVNDYGSTDIIAVNTKTSDGSIELKGQGNDTTVTIKNSGHNIAIRQTDNGTNKKFSFDYQDTIEKVSIGIGDKKIEFTYNDIDKFNQAIAMPVLPTDSAAGTYVLKATATGSALTFAWVVETTE